MRACGADGAGQRQWLTNSTPCRVTSWEIIPWGPARRSAFPRLLATPRPPPHVPSALRCRHTQPHLPTEIIEHIVSFIDTTTLDEATRRWTEPTVSGKGCPLRGADSEQVLPRSQSLAPSRSGSSLLRS